MNQRYPRLFASLITIIFFGMIGLYVREFPVFANSIHIGRMVIGAMLIGLAVSAGFVWLNRERFTPWNRHIPDVLVIIVLTMVFSPLLASWLNRGFGKTENQSFEFVAESPFVKTGYGVMKGEKLQPSGYHLFVNENGETLKFTYKTQAYYPVTAQGEKIMLPVCRGLFGTRVMLLK